MVKKVIPPIRELSEVPDYELKEAIIDFCNRLHIHGMGDGYDIYEAVNNEKKKAKAHQNNERLKSAG